MAISLNSVYLLTDRSVSPPEKEGQRENGWPGQTSSTTIPPSNTTSSRKRTSIEKRVFDKTWNIKTGWFWKDTTHGRVFHNRTTRIEEKELSKVRLEAFGDTGPWRHFANEAETIFHEVKEPGCSFGSKVQNL